LRKAFYTVKVIQNGGEKPVPKYSKSDINYIVREGDFERLYRNCETKRDKAWCSVLWLTGCRPSEALEITKDNINFEEGFTSFLVSTKKLGFKKQDKFVILKRKLILRIPKSHHYINNLIIYTNKFKPEERIFQFSRKTGINIITRVSRRALNLNLCPYNFRHSRMTLLAEAGATLEELKRFKGARTDSSVKPYIHARAVEYSVDFEI
jgi:integrase